MKTVTTAAIAPDSTLLDKGRPEFIDPEYTIIRPKDVSALTGLARSTVNKYIHEDPTFPRPVPLSNSKHRGAPIGFVLAEVQAWIKSRISAREERAAKHANN